MHALLLSLALLAPHAAQDAEPTFEQRVDELAEMLVDAEFTPGIVVGVLREGKPWVKGYGTTAPGTETRPDGKTLYEIGSISKVFTGILLSDAVQRGLVELEDPLTKHLPEGVTLNNRRREPVRLIHLTTHTSGFQRDATQLPSWGTPDPFSAATPERIYAVLAENKILRAPGKAYAYSNLAAGLLGHVMELVNESGYEELLTSRICTPLGLPDTRITLSTEQRTRFAPAYGEGGKPRSEWTFDALVGCGGIRSTVDDLLQFARMNLGAIAGQEFALADTLTAAHELHHEFKSGGGVALGWHIEPGGRSIWHNGGTGGYRAYLAIDPVERVAVAVLANTTTPNVDVVGLGVLAALRGEEFKAPRYEIPAEIAGEVLAQHAGRYQLNPKLVFTITHEPRGLFAQLTGQGDLRIYPIDEDHFFYRAVDARITFERDDEGKTTALVLHQGGIDQRAERIE